jgi:hypothetical protein
MRVWRQVGGWCSSRLSRYECGFRVKSTANASNAANPSSAGDTSGGGRGGEGSVLATGAGAGNGTNEECIPSPLIGTLCVRLRAHGVGSGAGVRHTGSGGGLQGQWMTPQ